jgi:broad specificity phosphatase PhoE
MMSRYLIRWAISTLFVLCFFLPVIASAQATQDIAWTQLRQGLAVALIRHAIAPGLGDPPGFRIGDCTTQRNLSQEGRDQARRIGEFFLEKGVKETSVYSSQWCRCLETARLLALGPVKELPALNSFFEDRSTEESQTKQLRKFIMSLPADKPVIMVTHQVNITALTGIVPSSGEIIILQLTKDGQGKVLVRFTP